MNLKCNEPDDCFTCPYTDCINTSQYKVPNKRKIRIYGDSLCRLGCGRPAENGYKSCDACRKKQREYQQTRKDYLKKEDKNGTAK